LARRKLPESLDELTERGGRYGEAILWYNLSLWWQEEQLRARGETGARNVDDAAVENDLAGAYMNRDPARKAKTAAYFEVGRRAYRQLDYFAFGLMPEGRRRFRYPGPRGRRRSTRFPKHR
jgi:hypothetical protein